MAKRRHRSVNREADNLKRFKSVDGERVEIAVPRVWISKATVFNSSGPGQPFSRTDHSGPFLEHLIGLLMAQPPYVRPEDRMRHVAFLHDLSSFHVRAERWDPKSVDVGVRYIALSSLGGAVEQWIESYYRHRAALMMVTFALDTAAFIRAHFEGHEVYRGGDNWKINRVVESDDDDQRYRANFCFLDDAQFKKQVTEQIGRTLTIARISKGCSLIPPRPELKTLDAGTEFLFEAQRCHLSSGIYDYNFYELKGEKEPRFDLSEDLRLFGTVLLQSGGIPVPIEIVGRNDDLLIFGDFGNTRMEIPARWITHVVVFTSDHPRRTEAIAVPEWK